MARRFDEDVVLKLVDSVMTIGIELPSLEIEYLIRSSLVKGGAGTKRYYPNKYHITSVLIKSDRYTSRHQHKMFWTRVS